MTETATPETTKVPALPRPKRPMGPLVEPRDVSDSQYREKLARALDKLPALRSEGKEGTGLAYHRLVVGADALAAIKAALRGS